MYQELHSSDKKRPADEDSRHNAGAQRVADRGSGFQGSILAQRSVCVNIRRWWYHSWLYAGKQWPRDDGEYQNLPRPFLATPASQARNPVVATVQSHPGNSWRQPELMRPRQCQSVPGLRSVLYLGARLYLQKDKDSRLQYRWELYYVAVIHLFGCHYHGGRECHLK